MGLRWDQLSPSVPPLLVPRPPLFCLAAEEKKKKILMSKPEKFTDLVLLHPHPLPLLPPQSDSHLFVCQNKLTFSSPAPP